MEGVKLGEESTWLELRTFMIEINHKRIVLWKYIRYLI